MFLGWWMLGFAAAAFFMSAPGQSYSVAAFKDPMRGTLGVSETDYSLAYSFATILSGLSLPFVGRLLDRYGARRLLPALGLLLAGGCLLMSRVTDLLSLYVGFSTVRCLGQGALTLVGSWIVGEWFHLRRGLATAVAGLGSSLSVISFPILNRLIIANAGWQTAWQVLAALVATVMVVPVALFLRDRPEDVGLHPDGIEPYDEPSESAEPPAAVPVVRTAPGLRAPMIQPTSESWTVGEVLRDATFWKLLSVPATTGMVGTGLVFHQVAILGTRGVSPIWALSLISLQATVSAVVTLPAGWATDRVESRFLLATAMLFLAAAVGIVVLMPIPQLAIVYAVLAGLQGSILQSTGNVVWINYYGRGNQGSVRGLAYSVMVLAAAVGPLPLALSIDRTGSWTLALLFFLIAPLVAAVLVWSARAPVRPVEAD